MELWDHQKRLIGDIYSKIKGGLLKILVASSTGSGKTVIFSYICRDILAKNKRVLIVVDDSPLIAQTQEKLSAFGLQAGVIKSGHKPNYSLPCQIASIDSLIRRDYPPADVVIIDEAHLSYSTKYRKLFEFYEGKIFLGFSATPERTSKKEALIRDWQILVRGLTIQEAIAEGINAPFVVYSVERDSLRLGTIRTRGGDYVSADLSVAMRSPKVIQRAIEEWKKKATGRMTIGFGVDIAHIDQLCAAFNKAGIRSETIDGRDKEETTRQEKYRKLREREIDVLFSVNVLTLGFDEKGIECVLCCRPTKSLIMWIQMVGRALRICPGKDEVIILDQAENNRKLMHPLAYEPQDLTNPKIRDKQEAPTKDCPECDASVLSFAMKCPHCGYVFPPAKKHEDLSEMVEMTARVTNDKLLNQKKVYAKFLDQARVKGYDPWWAAEQYKERFYRYPSSIHKKHALYGAAYTEKNVKQFMEYLVDVAGRKGKDQQWIEKKLAEEFGKITQK